jgi:hypothetical protein
MRYAAVSKLGGSQDDFHEGALRMFMGFLKGFFGGILQLTGMLIVVIWTARLVFVWSPVAAWATSAKPEWADYINAWYGLMAYEPMHVYVPTIPGWLAIAGILAMLVGAYLRYSSRQAVRSRNR